MSIWESLEEATGIDVPDCIEGIPVPAPDLGDLANSAGALVDVIGDMAGEAADLVNQCGKVSSVVGKGRSGSKECFRTFLNVKQVFLNLDDRMEPLRPLLDGGFDVFTDGLLTKENFDAVAALVLEFLNVGNLMKKLSSLVSTVGAAFETIRDVMGPLIDKAKEYIEDLVDDLFDSLQGIGGVLSPLHSGNGSGTRALSFGGDEGGVLGKCSGVVDRLMEIYDGLGPLAQAWTDASYGDAAEFAINNWKDIQQSFSQILPAWNDCKIVFKYAKSAADAMFQFVKSIWSTFYDFIQNLCSQVGIDLPGDVTQYESKVEVDSDLEDDGEELELDEVKQCTCSVS